MNHCNYAENNLSQLIVQFCGDWRISLCNFSIFIKILIVKEWFLFFFLLFPIFYLANKKKLRIELFLLPYNCNSDVFQKTYFELLSLLHLYFINFMVYFYPTSLFILPYSVLVFLTFLCCHFIIVVFNFLSSFRYFPHNHLVFGCFFFLLCFCPMSPFCVDGLLLLLLSLCISPVFFARVESSQHNQQQQHHHQLTKQLIVPFGHTVIPTRLHSLLHIACTCRDKHTHTRSRTQERREAAQHKQKENNKSDD